MKKLFFVCLLFLCHQFVSGQSLTRDERRSALKYLDETSKELFKSLKGLTSSQLNFHESDRWSPLECLYHIAFSEGAIRATLDGVINTPADPAARAEVKMTDAEVKGVITNRTQKVKTQAPFEPQNTGFKSFEEAMSDYKVKRDQLKDLIRNTKVDLRSHIATFPFGKIDAYQVILFIAGHTSRHTAQINEVKSASAFPRM